MITAQGDLDPFMTPEPMGTETLRHLSKVAQLCHAPPPLRPGQAVPRQCVWRVLSLVSVAQSFRSLLPSASYLTQLASL